MEVLAVWDVVVKVDIPLEASAHLFASGV